MDVVHDDVACTAVQRYLEGDIKTEATTWQAQDDKTPESQDVSNRRRTLSLSLQQLG